MGEKVITPGCYITFVCGSNKGWYHIIIMGGSGGRITGRRPDDAGGTIVFGLLMLMMMMLSECHSYNHRGGITTG
jgi:hypothetical protein